MFSLASRFLRRLVERGENRNEKPSLSELRQSMEKISIFFRPPRSVVVERVRAGGVCAEWIAPRRGEAERALLYLHGGAFCSGSSVTHRHLVGRIAKLTRSAALVPDYRLAPEHPFPAALEDCLSCYRELMSRGFPPGRIVIAGDSAGGNLVLSTLLSLRDAGSPLPAAAVCLSPVTNLARTDEATKSSDIKRARLDPMVGSPNVGRMIELYVGHHDPSEPLLSPLFGELAGLPPLLIHAGGDELLLPDAQQFAERARRAGVDVTLAIYPGMWHVWQIFVPYLPEARRAVAAIAEFIRSRAAERSSIAQPQL